VYREDINRLEITKNRTYKILNLLKKNKVIVGLVAAAVLVRIINTIFIVNFFILQSHSSPIKFQYNSAISL
jgi:hypothetical protein